MEHRVLKQTVHVCVCKYTQVYVHMCTCTYIHADSYLGIQSILNSYIYIGLFQNSGEGGYFNKCSENWFFILGKKCYTKISSM